MTLFNAVKFQTHDKRPVSVWVNRMDLVARYDLGCRRTLLLAAAGEFLVSAEIADVLQRLGLNCEPDS